MKRILSVFLLPMVLLIFYGTAMAENSAAGKACADKTDTKQIVTAKQEKNDKEPAATIKPLAKIDRHAQVQCIPHERHSRYCTPVLSHFCQELCGDVSQSRGGGSNRWGKQCSVGLMRKCNRCGFLE